MTSRDFCYWLQGALEIMDPESLTSTQLDVIQNHLNMVFIHEIDPSMGNKEMQNKLNEAHKPTLEELGKKHGFTVNNDIDNGLMRC